MANKTKNDLLQEIEELNKQLREAEQDLIKYEQIAECLNMAEEYKLIYDNYIKAGFTEEQAFDLLRITMDKSIPEFMRDIRYNRNHRNHVSYIRY